MVSSWEGARDRNATEAKDVLDQAAIPYAAIRDQSPHRGHLAVAIADKQRVIAAFERFGHPESFLAGVPWTRQVRLYKNHTRRRFQFLVRKRLRMSSSFILSQTARIGTEGRVFGLAYGTSISFWTPAVDEAGAQKLYGSASNRWSNVVPVVGEDERIDTTRILSRALTGKTHIDDVEFPIDLVCLWVDGSDPEWTERRLQRMGGTGGDDVSGLASDANQAHLYRDHDELRYALRSIAEFAPFINHVYLVTDRQTPSWLDATAGGITIVDHSEIFPSGALPVFNSNAIDTRLHHIDGLSEHFLVTNDDVLFLSPVQPSDFFIGNGQQKMFLSKARIPIGQPIHGEPGVDSAAKTNRSLIEQQYGVTITQKFKHIVLAQRRSIRSRAESTYAKAVQSTTWHPFREMNDVSFSHLCLYEALRTGDAVLSTLPYDYVSLGDSNFDARLTALEMRPGALKVLCLNDADASTIIDDHGRPIGQLSVDPEARDARLASFLETMFPTPCRWERSSAESAP